MAEPLTSRDLLSVIRALPADDRQWLLTQLEQDSALSNADLAEMAMRGGAFDDLAEDPDLYGLCDGEPLEVG
jgi:hypothetical protein